MDESIYVNINAGEIDRQHGTTDATDTRKQTSQHTGRDYVKNRSPRSVLVCLVVLCVLLLTAVIVLCILIYTNNHQFNINNKNITQEDQTDERDQLLEYKNLTLEKDELLFNNTNLTEQKEQLTQQINKLWRILNETDGWTYYHSSFYYISSEKKSWSESRKYCRERGADLIIINNKEEQDFVINISNPAAIWIGLSDSEEEVRWKWVDGSTMNYSSWVSGEPNRQTRENCAVSYYSEWYDYSCKTAYKWICEKKL